MASLIGFWIDIIEESIEPQDCILSGGDSLTAMGWLQRTNFREEGENNQDWVAKQRVGRKVATLVIKNELVLYRQWIAGVFNILADSLSRDDLFLNESSHLFLLKYIFDDQLPDNFHLKEVPKEIGCFISSTLELMPETKQRLKIPKPSKMLLRIAGDHYQRSRNVKI